jgi:hypothetical protein
VESETGIEKGGVGTAGQRRLDAGTALIDVALRGYWVVLLLYTAGYPLVVEGRGCPS